MYHNSNSVGTLSLLPCSMENGEFVTNVKWKIENFHGLSFELFFLSPVLMQHDPMKNEPFIIQFRLIKHSQSTIVTIEYRHVMLEDRHEIEWKFCVTLSHPISKEEFEFSAVLRNNIYYGSKTLVDDLRECLATIYGETITFDGETLPTQNCFKETVLAFIDKEYNEDFVIECDGQEFKVKKIILQARSPVFQTMLSNYNFKETQENRMVINDYGSEIVGKMVEFFETDFVSNTAECEVELFEIARKYMNQSFMEFTRLPFVHFLTIENYERLLRIAGKHEDKETEGLLNERFLEMHQHLLP